MTTAFPGQLSGSYTYDYLNPFMSAVIVTPTTRYPLWTTGTNNQSFNITSSLPNTLSNPDLGPLQALSFLSELVIENNLGDVPKITATLTPPLLDALRFMDSELVEFGVNTIEVQFGYAKGATINGSPGSVLSNPLSGLLLRPDISFGKDATIVLNASGVGGYAMNLQESGGSATQQKTRQAFIMEICARHAVTPDFTSFTSSTDQAAQMAMMTEVIDYTQGWKTDWSAIQDLCRQARCFAMISGTTGSGAAAAKSNLVILPRASMTVAEPTLVLAFFQLQGGIVGSTTYPILSASTDTAALWLPGVSQMLMVDVDPMAKTANPMPITNKTAQPFQITAGPDINPAGSGNVLPAPNTSAQTGTIRRPGNPAVQANIDAANSAFEALKTAMGVPLDIETIGCPTLLPGMVVQVIGLGRRLAGNYGVFKVTHTLNASGYTTSLHLISNTGAVLTQTLQAQNATPPNTMAAAQDGSTTTKQAQSQ